MAKQVGYNNKHRETVCIEPGCDQIFLKRPHTNRKYCDVCSERRNNRTYRPRRFKCQDCGIIVNSLRVPKNCGIKMHTNMVEVTDG